MGILIDLVQSLYNFSYIAKELSRRRPWRVVVTFLVLVILYGVVASTFYSRMVSQLIKIVGEEARHHVISFSIKDGLLSSPAQQPYIITDKDLSQEFYASLVEWMGRLPFTRRVNFGTIERLASRPQGEAVDRSSGFFCFVLDTTGTYKELINEDNFTDSIVMLKDRLRYTERRGAGRKYREFLFSGLKNKVAFRPEDWDTFIRVLTRSAATFVWMGVMAATLVRFFIKVLLVALVGYIISRVRKIGLKFWGVFAIAVFALTPSVLLGVIARRWHGFPEILIFFIYAAYVIIPVAIYPHQTTEGTQEG